MKILVKDAPANCKDCIFNRDEDWAHCILLDASTEFTDKWGHDLGYGKLKECPLEEQENCADNLIEQIVREKIKQHDMAHSR